MNPSTACLNDDDVQALLNGRTSAADLPAAEEHLSHCQRCRDAIEAKLGSRQWWDDLEMSLTSAAADSSTTESSVEGDALKQLLDLLGPTDDPTMLGRIGPYEVLGGLGQGGMGAVFKAFDPALNRYVAVKILLPHLSASGAARNRFAREAQAAAAIVDDHVMAIHNVDEWQGNPYFVMPYKRGASLQKRLNENGPLQLREVLRIGSQVAAGLAAAHAQGIVHRDIKPANIFSEDGVERVQLMDFGLARAVDDASLTRTGILAGTPQYMAPEQARAESVDARSDLFSLGAVLYAMCTGRPPFRADSAYGILRLITDKEPRPIREINPDIPDWLCALIAKLMAKQPQNRFESAREVAELLEDCLAHVQQPAKVALPDGLPVAERAQGRDRESPVKELATAASKVPPARGSRRWLLMAGGLLALFFAGILILLELDKGTLRIESEANDVPIQIVRGGEAVKMLTVTQGEQSVRIAADRYVVKIDGAVEGLAVDDGHVSIRRRDQQTVKIVHIDLPVAKPDTEQPVGPPVDAARAEPRQETDESDSSLARDLQLLQGSWELLHGNEGKGPPNTRSVKTIVGNKETLRRYNIKTGTKLREHTVEFQLSKSGSARVLTFYSVGGSPEHGQSYFYRVDKDNFYDITGLMHGKQHRNYQQDVKVWHWKRVGDSSTNASDSASDKIPDTGNNDAASGDSKPEPPREPAPLPDTPLEPSTNDEHAAARAATAHFAASPVAGDQARSIETDLIDAQLTRTQQRIATAKRAVELAELESLLEEAKLAHNLAVLELERASASESQLSAKSTKDLRAAAQRAMLEVERLTRLAADQRQRSTQQPAESRNAGKHESKSEHFAVPETGAAFVPWQDNWRVVRTELRGREIQPGLTGQMSTPLEIEVRGFEISVRWSSGGKTDGKLKLDIDGDPHGFECDWLIPVYGIYKIEKDRLTICYNPSGTPHAETPPTAFSTSADSDRVLCVFQRQSTKQHRELADEIARLRREEQKLLAIHSSNDDRVSLARQKLAVAIAVRDQALDALASDQKQAQLKHRAAITKLGIATRHPPQQPAHDSALQRFHESELKRLRELVQQSHLEVIRADTLATTAKEHLAENDDDDGAPPRGSQ